MATIDDIAREHRRDRGLVRAMGVMAFAAAITNEVVGSGIYRLPASLAGAAGTAAPYAYLACIVAMGAVVLCFAEAGSRVPTSGGPYGYVGMAFGPMWGFVAGMLLWLSSVLAAGGIAAALADTARAAFPALTDPVIRGLLIVAVLAAMAWVNVIGVDLAARILGWATLVKLLPLFLFLIVGGIGLMMGHAAPMPIDHAPATGFGHAVLLALFALGGMETPLAASGEVRDPARTVPRALFVAMGSIALLYVAIQVVADSLLGAGLIGSAAPLADALGTIDPRLRAPLLAGAFFSMLIWLGSDFLGAPRMLFAFARDGLLPAAVGEVHPRWRTPHRAILIHFLIATALALTGTFEMLAVLSALAMAPLYGSVSAAALMLRRRGVAILGEPLRVPGLPWVAAVAIVSMIAMIAMADGREIAAMAGVIVASALLYRAMRARFSR